MKIIDLSLPLTHKMDVFPGDPEVDIVEIHKLDTEGWRLRLMSLTTHIGTHVNVPFHMVEAGKKLDEISLDSFVGQASFYHPAMTIDPNQGIIFKDTNITSEIADILIASPPKFVGLSTSFEFDIALEKLLLEHDIISYENLNNLELLPDTFYFSGLPLNIPGADGSPVRAVAMID